MDWQAFGLWVGGLCRGLGCGWVGLAGIRAVGGCAVEDAELQLRGMARRLRCGI